MVTFVIDNRAVEDMEQFTASISPIPGLFPVAVKNSTATVTIIDNDGEEINYVIGCHGVQKIKVP